MIFLFVSYLNNEINLDLLYFCCNFASSYYKKQIQSKEMFNYYLFSKHKDQYRTIAKSLGCSPQTVYKFAHRKPIRAKSRFEEKIKEQLVEFGIIHHAHKH